MYLSTLVLQVLKIGLSKITIDPDSLLKQGFGQNPLPVEQFDKIYNDNLGILVMAGLLI